MLGVRDELLLLVSLHLHQSLRADNTSYTFTTCTVDLSLRQVLCPWTQPDKNYFKNNHDSTELAQIDFLLLSLNNTKIQLLFRLVRAEWWHYKVTGHEGFVGSV